MFCNEAWIDFYLLGLDGLDVAMVWWFFFFCFLIWVFGGQWWRGGLGGGGVVMIGLFGC